jgi:hypothetical protein
MKELEMARTLGVERSLIEALSQITNNKRAVREEGKIRYVFGFHQATGRYEKMSLGRDVKITVQKVLEWPTFTAKRSLSGTNGRTNAINTAPDVTYTRTNATNGRMYVTNERPNGISGGTYATTRRRMLSGWTNVTKEEKMRQTREQRLQMGNRCDNRKHEYPK